MKKRMHSLRSDFLKFYKKISGKKDRSGQGAEVTPEDGDTQRQQEILKMLHFITPYLKKGVGKGVSSHVRIGTSHPDAQTPDKGTSFVSINTNT